MHKHYEGCIFFAEVEGCGSVLCFKNMAGYTINDKWYLEKKENIVEEAECLVSAAAKIVRAEIRERIHYTKSYPTNEDIANANVIGMDTIHLQTFLVILTYTI